MPACLIVRENGSSSGQRFDIWPLQKECDKTPAPVRVHGPLSSNSGELVRVLPAYAMPDADIHWLAPYRRTRRGASAC